MLKLVSSRKNSKGEKELDIISEHLQAKPEFFSWATLPSKAARSHEWFLSQQPRLMQILSRSSRKSKIASVKRVRFQGDFTAIWRLDIARVSNLLETECNFAAIFQGWLARDPSGRFVKQRREGKKGDKNHSWSYNEEVAVIELYCGKISHVCEH